MDILFLGTSSGWPLPRLGCKCNICTSHEPKDKRLRPSILINKEILIDANTDIYHELKTNNVDPTKIKAIILTHAHDDHIMGLYDLSHIYGNKEKINLISTYGILSQTSQKLGVSMTSFKKVFIKPLEKYQLDNNSIIWLIPVIHTVEAYGIKIKAPKPIFYAPEFRKILPSNIKGVSDVDLAIIDGSSKTSIGQSQGHETIEGGLRVGSDLHSKKIIFTNIGHKTDTHSQLEYFVREKGGNKFSIAFDGLSIKL